MRYGCIECGKNWETWCLLYGRRYLNNYLEFLKELGHNWWSLFTIAFYPKILYISSMKPFLNRTTIFKLIVHEIELHSAFEERENKQKNAKFQFKKIRVIFLFPQNCISNAIWWEKKDNSKLRNIYKHKWLVTMFTNKGFSEWFQLCLFFNPFRNGLYIFGWLSVKILLEFMSNIFCKQTLSAIVSKSL